MSVNPVGGSVAPPAATSSTVTTVTVFGATLFVLLPLSTDIYLPAMIDLARDLDTVLAGAQRTMIAFTAGFALSHFLIGGLADRLGRRPVALGGLLLFVVASALGAASPTLEWLLAARFIQGCAAATGPILARAIIRDVVPDQEAGRALSFMGALVGIAPIAAPLIGSLAVGIGGWRVNMGLLACYAAVLAVILAWRLPETLPETLRRGNGPVSRPLSPLSSLRVLVHERAFVRGTMIIAAGYGAMFTWLSTSPFLLMGTLQMTRVQASLVYALGSAGFVGGGLLSARLASRVAPGRILGIGALLTVIGTVACLAAVATGASSWPAVAGVMLPFYVGWGLCQPQATAIAMRPFSKIAGHASAWLGVIQQVGAILLSSLAVAFGGGLASLGIMIFATTLLAAASNPAKTQRTHA